MTLVLNTAGNIEVYLKYHMLLSSKNLCVYYFLFANLTQIKILGTGFTIPFLYRRKQGTE